MRPPAHPLPLLPPSQVADITNLNDVCKFTPGRIGRKKGEVVVIDCAIPFTGRYVSLQINSAAGSTDVLSMAQVQVSLLPTWGSCADGQSVLDKVG